MKLSPLPSAEFDMVLWLGRRLTETPDWIKTAISKDPYKPGAIMRMGSELHVWTPDGLQIAHEGSILLYAGEDRIFVVEPKLFAALFADNDPERAAMIAIPD